MSVTDAQEQKRLRLGSASQPPVVHDGDGSPGFLDIVLGKAFSTLGVDIEIVSLPAERALLNANSGVDDGDALRVAGLEKRYPNLVRVAESVFTVEFVAVARKGAPQVGAWSDLAGRSIGMINGWKIVTDSLAGIADLSVVASADQLFALLANGRADYIIFSRYPTLHYIDANDLDAIEMQGQMLDREEMYTYLNKKHATLAVRLAESLRQMKVSGEYEAIRERFFSQGEKLN